MGDQPDRGDAGWLGATLAASHVGSPTPPSRGEEKRVESLPVVGPEHYGRESEAGRGGLGRVLRARDRRLDRPVALKELLSPDDDAAAARFVREALVTARLQHPGIVPVYEAGRWPTGEPFYAMKLVAGRTLLDAIAARRSLDARLALVPNVLAVAEAIAYAHSEGVIHRDLKPANVVLGPYGETVVVDWGLAKDRRLADEPEGSTSLYELAHASMTRVGSVIGTPAYMPPEQARGEPVDERADVYALGAMLYHVLTAAQPYEGPPDAVLEKVQAGPPRSVDERAPGAPRDLRAIVDKAMARDPAGRYASAKAFAEDLSRFLTGQLVGAREYGPWAIVWRWLRRNRGAVAVALLLLAALAVTATVAARRVVRERNVARARGDELLLVQARSWLERDPTATLAWLKQVPPGADHEAVQALAADAVSRGVARHVLVGPGEIVAQVAFSPDGALVAAGSNNRVTVWRADDGRTVDTFEVSGEIMRLAFEPAGALLVGTHDGAVVARSPGRGAVARRLAVHPSWVTDLDVAPDREHVASASDDGLVMVSALHGNGPATALRGHSGAVTALAWNADGAALYSASLDGTIRRWRPAAGVESEIVARFGRGVTRVTVQPSDGAVVAAVDRQLLLVQPSASPHELVTHRDRVVDAAWLPDGSAVISADATGEVWRTTLDGDHTRLYAQERPIVALRVGDDGSIATGDSGGDVWLWQAGDVRRLSGHARAIRDLAFARGGALLASAGQDARVRIWDVDTRRPVWQLSSSDVFRVAFVDAGKVVTTARDGGVRMVDLASGEVRELGRHSSAAYDVEVLPDGRVATGGWDGELVVWSRDRMPPRRFRHGAQIWNIAVAPDGATLASAGADGKVWRWDLRQGTGAVVHHHETGDAADVAFSPDGRLLASSGVDGNLVVTELATGTSRVRRIGVQLGVLSFSRDGRVLRIAGWDGTLRLWFPRTDSLATLPAHHGAVRALAVTRDDALLATGSVDRTALLWGRDTVQALRGNMAEVRHLDFSPDGQQLASAGWDETVRRWDLLSGGLAIERGHDALVHRVSFSPDGAVLVSTSADGTLRLWPARADSAPAAPHALRAWIEHQTSASTDGVSSIASPDS